MELRKQGVSASRPRVARLMQQCGIRSIVSKKYRVCTTDSNHGFMIAKNHLNRQFQVERPSSAWVSDISYIPTRAGWLYLTIIMDLFDRKIIGWSVSQNMEAISTVIAAWRMAIKNRPVHPGLIFHSDRGVQYACKEFVQELKSFEPSIIQSMSRKANCWDNAVAESFFKIIKSELNICKPYKPHSQTKIDLFDFIEIWYNRKRSHSSLGYLSPSEYEKQHFLKTA